MSGQADEPAERAVEPAEPDGRSDSAAEPAEDEPAGQVLLGEPVEQVGPIGRDEEAEPVEWVKPIRPADASTERATPGMRLLGFGLIAGAVAAVVRVAADGAGGDWRRLVAAVGYGTAVLVGGLGLNGWPVGLSLRRVWLFPATMSFLGVTMIVDPDYGDPTWSGAAVVGDVVVHFGSAMVVAGVFGFLLYASAVAARPVRHR